MTTLVPMPDRPGGLTSFAQAQHRVNPVTDAPSRPNSHSSIGAPRLALPRSASQVMKKKNTEIANRPIRLWMRREPGGLRSPRAGAMIIAIEPDFFNIMTT